MNTPTTKPDQPPRKVIQIATLPHTNTIDSIVVLCDDGTMWTSSLPGFGYPMGWRQISPP